jgi:WD40 repeat protein
MKQKINYSNTIFLFLIYITATILSGCNANSKQDANNLAKLLENSSNRSEKLVPILIFTGYAGYSFIVDYENEMYSHFPNSTGGVNFNQKYIVSYYGTYYDINSLEELGSLKEDNCHGISSNFLSEDLIASVCQVTLSQQLQSSFLQIWDIEKQLKLKEIPLKEDDFEGYHFIIPSPDSKLILLSGYHKCARLFNSTSLEEIPLDNDCLLAGELVQSANTKFVVSDGSMPSIWQFTENGIELVEKFDEENITGVSITPDGETMAYCNHRDGFISIVDRNMKKEIKRINTGDIFDYIFSSSRLSPDGKYLFISRRNVERDKYQLDIVDIQSENIIYSFTNDDSTIPSDLKILYGPESIRTSFNWKGWWKSFYSE